MSCEAFSPKVGLFERPNHLQILPQLAHSLNGDDKTLLLSSAVFPTHAIRELDWKWDGGT